MQIMPYRRSVTTGSEIPTCFHSAVPRSATAWCLRGSEAARAQSMAHLIRAKTAGSVDEKLGSSRSLLQLRRPFHSRSIPALFTLFPESEKATAMLPKVHTTQRNKS